jgi:predicted GNAT family N-acyltransferase
VRIAITDGLTTRELRRATLRPSWPVGSVMHGDDNPDAVHVAAFDDDETLVGGCLVLPRPYPQRPEEPDAWQLRGMATVPQRRSQGIGTAVLDAAVETVVEHGGRLLWCDARTTARAFYAQHGFVADGAEFLHAESGIPHYRMWRQVP